MWTGRRNEDGFDDDQGHREDLLWHELLQAVDFPEKLEKVYNPANLISSREIAFEAPFVSDGCCALASGRGLGVCIDPSRDDCGTGLPARGSRAWLMAQIGWPLFAKSRRRVADSRGLRKAAEGCRAAARWKHAL